MPDRLTLIALKGIPLVKPGDGLANLIGDALEQSDEQLADGDILVVAQKIVSKTENRLVDVTTIEPSDQAKDLAVEVDKDPRVVEMILRESRAVIRKKPGVLIVENNLGLIMANAGIDHSNVESEVPERTLLLLPEDPDASAKRLQRAIRCKFGVDVGVIINDSVGRPGALGQWGWPSAYRVYRQSPISEVIKTFSVANSASARRQSVTNWPRRHPCYRAKRAEGKPVVLVRGFRSDAPSQSATATLRAAEEDMFR